MQPRRRPSTSYPQRYTTNGDLVVTRLGLAGLALGLLALAITFAVLQTRTDNRYSREREDVHQLRTALDLLQMQLDACNCNGTSPPASSKDSKSDAKTTVISIPQNVVTNITNWNGNTSFPLNGGASSTWDPVTGVYTVAENGTYSATFSALMSLGGGQPGTVAISFLATRAGNIVSVFPSLVEFSVSNTVFQGLTAFVGLDFQLGDTIQFALIQTGAAPVNFSAFIMSILQER